MFIICSIIYIVATIIAVPALIVFAYMAHMNKKYGDVITIFGRNSAGAGGTVGVIAIAYLFIAGFCIGDLAIIWTSFLFLICITIGIAAGIIICRFMKFSARDKIKYADVIKADEQICVRILSCSNQMQELKKTMAATSTTAELKEMNKQRISMLQSTLDKLTNIHQELQQQKIVLNACLSTGEMKNVKLGDNISVNKALDKELLKFSSYADINDSFRDVRSIMKKYKV